MVLGNIAEQIEERKGVEDQDEAGQQNQKIVKEALKKVDIDQHGEGNGVAFGNCGAMLGYGRLGFAAIGFRYFSVADRNGNGRGLRFQTLSRTGAAEKRINPGDEGVWLTNFFDAGKKKDSYGHGNEVGPPPAEQGRNEPLLSHGRAGDEHEIIAADQNQGQD